jgi:hypothetical protein
MLDDHKNAFADYAEGLMVVFNYEEPFDPKDFVGRVADIRLPNGTVLRNEIMKAETRSSALGLLLRGLKRGDVTAGSELLRVSDR